MQVRVLRLPPAEHSKSGRLSRNVWRAIGEGQGSSVLAGTWPGSLSLVPFYYGPASRKTRIKKRPEPPDVTRYRQAEVEQLQEVQSVAENTNGRAAETTAGEIIAGAMDHIEQHGLGEGASGSISSGGRTVEFGRQSVMPGIFPKKQEVSERLRSTVEDTLNNLMRQGLRLKKLSMSAEVVDQFESDDGTVMDATCKVAVTVQEAKITGE